MVSLWVAYSSGRPSGAALRAAGIVGVVRYVGVGSAGKRLTAAEYQDLTAAGVQVAGVVETTTTRSAAGYAAGVTDGRSAAADCAAMGCDPTMPLFATCDNTTWGQANLDYVRGFRDAVGQSRTGAYGFAPFVTAVHSAGTADWFWEAGHPSGAAWVHLWQRNGFGGTPTTATIGGVVCDLNEQYRQIAGGGSADMAVIDDAAYQVTHPWVPNELVVKDPNVDAMTLVDKVERLVWEMYGLRLSRGRTGPDTIAGNAANAVRAGEDAVDAANAATAAVAALRTDLPGMVDAAVRVALGDMITNGVLTVKVSIVANGASA